MDDRGDDLRLRAWRTRRRRSRDRAACFRLASSVPPWGATRRLLCPALRLTGGHRIVRAPGQGARVPAVSPPGRRVLRRARSVRVKRLIVTADDFGLCQPVNEAVEIAHREGILSTASLMVGGPAAADAVERARRLPGLRVGLHVVVVEDRPVLPPAQVSRLTDDRGYLSGRLVSVRRAVLLQPHRAAAARGRDPRAVRALRGHRPGARSRQRAQPHAPSPDRARHRPPGGTRVRPGRHARALRAATDLVARLRPWPRDEARCRGRAGARGWPRCAHGSGAAGSGPTTSCSGWVPAARWTRRR